MLKAFVEISLIIEAHCNKAHEHNSKVKLKCIFIVAKSLTQCFLRSLAKLIDFLKCDRFIIQTNSVSKEKAENQNEERQVIERVHLAEVCISDVFKNLRQPNFLVHCLLAKNDEFTFLHLLVDFEGTAHFLVVHYLRVHRCLVAGMYFSNGCVKRCKCSKHRMPIELCTVNCSFLILGKLVDFRHHS